MALFDSLRNFHPLYLSMYVEGRRGVVSLSKDLFLCFELGDVGYGMEDWVYKKLGFTEEFANAWLTNQSLI